MLVFAMMFSFRKLFNFILFFYKRNNVILASVLSTLFFVDFVNYHQSLLTRTLINNIITGMPSNTLMMEGCKFYHTLYYYRYIFYFIVMSKELYFFIKGQC